MRSRHRPKARLGSPGSAAMSSVPAGATPADLGALQRRHRNCTRCGDAGFIRAAHPVFSGRSGQRVLLVGQAPGPEEVDRERPFAGRAGRQLMRWLTTTYGDEATARERVYITSTTTCFPGRRPDGSGDRRPSGAEVALCAPWLDELIALLRPRLILPVGGLALTRLGIDRRLDDVVGRLFTPDGREVDAPGPDDTRLLLPLPHPSGQSRWLNDPARLALLESALARLPALVLWADGEPARASC